MTVRGRGVAIYRMMRPGEPPTEDAVEETPFHGLFFSRHATTCPRRPHEFNAPHRP